MAISVAHAALLPDVAGLGPVPPALSASAAASGRYLADTFGSGRRDGSQGARFHGPVVETAFLLPAAHHTASRQGPAPFGHDGRLGLGLGVPVGVDNHPVLCLPKLMRLARVREQRRKAPMPPCRMEDGQPCLACRVEPFGCNEAQAARLRLFPVLPVDVSTRATGGAFAWRSTLMRWRPSRSVRAARMPATRRCPSPGRLASRPSWAASSSASSVSMCSSP